MLEIIHPGAAAPDARVAIFDFDGTISLVRSGWMNVMIPMMVEILGELRTGESEEQLRAVIEDLVWRLTGKETLYQMIELAEQVRGRGGTPLEPVAYKRIYLDRLNEVIKDRITELRGGLCSPDKYMVPGARALLEALREHGLRLYLASGTDEIYMKDEAELLDVTRYFDGGVFGALDDLDAFSKRMLVQKIIRMPGIHGGQLIGFGDGYVEIEEVKLAGGVTVGVATDEPACLVPDAWKRKRLIGVGADYIVPNYLCQPALLPMLFANHEPL